MKITIAGIGYVGLSLALLFSLKNKVIAYDISEEKVNSLNSKCSPIKDDLIEDYLSDKDLNLKATTNKEIAFLDCDYLLICTPTNYDESTSQFDTSSVVSVARDCINLNPNVTIIIKSTIPLGFTEKLRQKLIYKNIIFSPEFLREGKALFDNLNPSRIIVGNESSRSEDFANLLANSSTKPLGEIPILLMKSDEAEAIKLFANTYLAMRIAFFNELDSYAETKGLNTEQIINGLGHDPRIGNYYNNPSFGYGGYCLPKDTNQLLKNYENIPNKIIKAIVDANKTRKDFIADSILKRKPKIVGIYRLVMKEGSDNFRTSAIQGIMKRIKSKGIEVIVYEPEMKQNKFFNSDVMTNLSQFKEKSDIIVANRLNDDLLDVKNKVYTRDIYNRD